MNMMPFLIYEAAKKKQRSSSKSSHKDTKPQKKTSMNRQFYDTPSTDTIESLIRRDEAFWASVKKQMYTMPEISEVLGSIDSTLGTVIQDYISGLYTKMDAFVEPSQELKKEYMDVVEKLKDAGLYASTNGSHDFHVLLPKVTPTQEHPGYDRAPNYRAINGFPLLEEQLTQGQNPYETRYLEYTKDLGNYEQKYLDLKERVTHLAKKRMILAVSKKKQAELESLRQELSSYEVIYNTATKYKKQAETFAHMSDDTKANLQKFFRLRKRLETMSSEIELLEEDSYYFSNHSPYKRKNARLEKFMQECIDSTIAKLDPEARAVLEKAPELIADKLCTVTGPELYDMKFENSIFYPSHNFTIGNLFIENIATKTKPLVQARIDKYHGTDNPTADGM